MDISLNIKFLGMKLLTDDHKIHVEGRVSQNSDLGLSFTFICQETGNFL